MYIINFVRGFCMALADSVPGVSGGTIAFVLGFYDKFINSLNSLMSSSSTGEKKEGIKFLLKLGIGWVIGFVLAVLFISSLFERQIYKISSLFIGFIIFAIPLIIKEEKGEIINKYGNILYGIIGAILVVILTYFNPSTSNGGISLAISDLNLGIMIYVFLAGAIAISAMVLPGISGSTLLLIFGLYAPIINSVKEVLTLNLDYLPILFVFTLGVIVGIAGTIKLIRYLLKNHRSKMIYLILGLMIGSIYSVVMGPTTLENPVAPMNFQNFSFLFFIVGGSLIIGLEKLKNSMEK